MSRKFWDSPSIYEAMVFKFQVYSVVLSKHQTSHTPLPHISLLLKKSLTTISYIPSTKEYLNFDKVQRSIAMLY